MKNYETIYHRGVVWVQPHPLSVRHEKVRAEYSGVRWTAGSVASCMVMEKPNGEFHVAVREDSKMFDFQPGLLGLELLHEEHDVTTVTELSPGAFDEMFAYFSASLKNAANIAKLIPIVERHAPAFRFVPQHLQHVIIDAIPPEVLDEKIVSVNSWDREKNYRVNLVRSFLRYDLSDFEAIVWLDTPNRYSGHQVSPKLIGEYGLQEERILNIGMAWYAVKTLDEAIEAKLRSKAGATEVYSLKPELIA